MKEESDAFEKGDYREAEVITIYRVVHLVITSGWVDYDLDFSTFCKVVLGLL